MFLLKFALIGVFVLCYLIGGRKWKWVRRILGSAIFGLGLVLFSLWQRCFSYYLLSYPILLFAALSLGYGGDSNWEKIRRRFIYGLCVGLSCLPVVIIYQRWGMGAIQVVQSILASIICGVANHVIPGFDMTAVEEEGIIAVASVFWVPYMLVSPTI